MNEVAFKIDLEKGHHFDKPRSEGRNRKILTCTWKAWDCLDSKLYYLEHKVGKCDKTKNYLYYYCFDDWILNCDD